MMRVLLLALLGGANAASCVCSNGTPAFGIACTVAGATKCIFCANGFHLNRSRACEAHTACGADEYASYGGSSFSDRICQQTRDVVGRVAGARRMGAFGSREGTTVALPDDAAIQDRLASLAARDAAIQDRIASLAARVAHLEAAKTPMGVAPPPGGGDSGNAKLRGVDIPELHEQPNVLDGCSHVYLDVGSNVGVQIRKLYDGRSVYPDAPVHDIFDKYFGKDHSKVCAIGFEPNPHHTKRLKAIQGCYQALGFRMSFVFAAASSTDGQATFNIDGVGWANEWSSSLVATDKISKNKGFFKHTVPTIDLAKFINNVVARRKIPAGVPPAVVMKLDIEGSEVTLLPHMMQTGVLCAERSQSVQPFPLGVNISFIEFHPMSFPAKSKEAHALYMLKNDLNEIVGLDTDNCKPTNITALDDETFLHDGKPFPDKCSQFE